MSRPPLGILSMFEVIKKVFEDQFFVVERDLQLFFATISQMILHGLFIRTAFTSTKNVKHCSSVQSKIVLYGNRVLNNSFSFQVNKSNI